MKSVAKLVAALETDTARRLDPCNELLAGRLVWRLIADRIGRRYDAPVFLTVCRKDHNVRVFK